MRKCAGHTVQDFAGSETNEPMFASQYFQLLRFINWEIEEEKKAHDKASRKKK